MSDEPTIEVSVPARAALAGNPSDGYGGAVVAMPIPGLAARLRVSTDDRFTIDADGDGDERGSAPDHTFGSLEDLVAHVDRHGFGDEARSLVLAAIRSMVRLTEIRPTPVRIDVGTTIPRSVGLAGSSAIVIAAVEALARAASIDRRVPAEPLDEPEAVAVVAHAAEVDELGIAAGLQDRLVQSYRVPVLMDFDPASSAAVLGRPAGRTRRLGPIPGDVVLGWRPRTSESSDVVHGGLRSRAGDDDVVQAMSELGRIARAAATAIDEADLTALGSAIDATFDVRRHLMDLDPDHVEMIDAVRAAGGHANYTGSGGAVVAVGPGGSAGRLATALAEVSDVDTAIVGDSAPNGRADGAEA